MVIDALEAAGDEVGAVLDESGATRSILGYDVTSHATAGADGFVVAIGDNEVRRERFEHYRSTGLRAVSVVHPSAVIAPGVDIGAGSVVFAGVIVNRDATIGENVILNTGCTVDHDCRIDDHVHVAPGVSLCGNVVVGEGALVGVGACAVPGAEIGPWAVVGAGSTVTEPVEAGVTVVGSPARSRQ